jgi:glycine/D-amino acid oxidase-like deaminating enzyme
VVRATEAYTVDLPGLHRHLVPIYSLMIATAPLPPSFWDTAGLARRETFSDYRHLLVYGQRTADDRIAFGGRGAPYHFGSRVRPGYDVVPRVHAALRAALVEMFPALADVEVTHVWGGPLGARRDWSASVGFDRDRGLAWAGGYVGDGVGAANLAGRTLADLITGARTELTALPWVGSVARRWEPEPLRWLGINAATAVMSSADAVEHRTGGAARRAGLINRLLGR